MKKIYLVDSENVGDVWVPLLVSSQPEDMVLVFYTQKSPHMNYENVRMLKETEKEAVFIKCFEGNNALDFQLVSELGYRLKEDGDSEYIIVSNDTGFDAVVRYWSARELPVSRLSGKECYRQLVGRKQRGESKQQDTASGRKMKPGEQPEAEEGNAQASSEQPEVQVQPEPEEQPEAQVQLEPEEQPEAQDRSESEEQPEAQVQSEPKEFPEMQEPSKSKEQPETEEAILQAAAKEQTEEKEGKAPEEPEGQPEAKKEKVSKQQPEAKKEKVSKQQPEAKEEKVSKQPGVEEGKAPEVSQEQPESEDLSMESMFGEKDDVVKTLFCCISKENPVDFHNALVAFLGEEEGKALYQEIKGNAEYTTYWAALPKSSQKEKFQFYCRMVFSHSEYAEEAPEDFADFLYQSNGKRKNLNSLRAALQGKYGKDKGMKYYSLFKSHIKIMNRM